jgi:hypothetical protein
MTIPVSTAPTAKLYLYNQIIALVNDPAVLVSYGEPGLEQPDDIIVVGAVSRQVVISQMVGSGGTGWLDETYTIGVDVEVYRGGADAPTADARAWALVGVVETVVRTDPSLGGAVIVAHPSENQSPGPAWEAKGLGVLVSITVLITCRARI